LYTNLATDPFSPANSGANGNWNLELQRDLTAKIGNANYDFEIGGYNDASGFASNNLPLNGNTQEIIIYLSNQSSNLSAINTNINTYYAIY
jgi:hypothetical protein